MRRHRPGRQAGRPAAAVALVAALLIAAALTGCTSGEAGGDDDETIRPPGDSSAAPSATTATSRTVGGSSTAPPRSGSSTPPARSGSPAPATASPPDTAASSPDTAPTESGTSPRAATSSSDPATQPAPPPPEPLPVFGSGEVTVTDDDLRDAAGLVERMSIRERAGAVIMAASSDVLGTSRIADLGLGGVILMGSRGVLHGTDGGTPAEVAALTARLQGERPDGLPPLLMATDQEYGLVVRMVNGFTDFPGAADLAAVADLERSADLTERVAAAAASELRAVGVTVNFAPVADLLPAAGPSAIGSRSYGSDPHRTAVLVGAAVQGYQDGGVAATVKHFPGLGRLGDDTHVTLPTLQVDCEEWDTAEAVPMRAGVDAGAALVMTGHVLVPAVGAELPASLAPEVVAGLLRGEDQDTCTGIGFAGIAVSDSLQMVPIADGHSSGQAAVLALAAGQDLLLMPVDPAAAVLGIVTAAEDGSLDPERLTEAATRVLALRIALDRIPRPPIDVVGSAEHRALADEARSAEG